MRLYLSNIRILAGKFALLEGICLDYNSPAFVGEKLIVQGEVIFMSQSFKWMEVRATIRKGSEVDVEGDHKGGDACVKWF